MFPAVRRVPVRSVTVASLADGSRLLLATYFSKPTVVRAALVGAVGVFFVGPVVGVLLSVAMWIGTHDPFYLWAALVVLVGTLSMGAAGGAAAHLTYTYIRLRRQTIRGILATLAFIEAYLSVASLIFWFLARYVPGLFADLCADRPYFHIVLHTYGVGLSLVAWVLLGVLQFFADETSDTPPPG